MPSVPELPEPRLTTREEWRHERQRIRALFEQWFYGKMPPAPDNLRAAVTGAHDEGGVTVRDVLSDATLFANITYYGKIKRKRGNAICN
jgi:hypothetical protein